MKVVLYLVLVFHSAFHLLGFLKAFDLANLSEIKTKISGTSGIIWLLTSVLFLATIGLMIFNVDWWIYPAVVAIITSQILIISTWKDSKNGTIINVILLVMILLQWGKTEFEEQYRAEVTEQLRITKGKGHDLLTEKDIMKLPEQVRKYLVYSGFLNKPKVENFRIRFNGNIRKSNEADWMPFTSEQYNFLSTSARLFFMKAEMKNIPLAGFHKFKNGEASMDIRLLSLFNVQYASGKEMGIAETVTFFNDICCMAPGALIDQRIEWVGENGDSVFAKFRNNDIQISATLVFNEKNELVNFISDDRYTMSKTVGMEKIRWSTPLKNYKLYHGYKLASSAATIYSYPDVELQYGTFELQEIDYNVSDF